MVSQCTAGSGCRPDDGATGSVYENAARTIEAAGFKVIRDPILARVPYRDANFDMGRTRRPNCQSSISLFLRTKLVG